MRLYSGSTQQFITDTLQNQIAEKLRLAFFDQFRYNPSPSEVNSWRNSLRALLLVLQQADLTDHGIILEYQLPQTSRRLDVLLTGHDQTGSENAIIVELKQWDKAQESHLPNEVLTFIGGNLREVPHPAVQVGQYHQYLIDTHTAFYSDSNPILLQACSYLHNYSYINEDALLSAKFSTVLQKYPLFSADDVRDLAQYLDQNLGRGKGLSILNKVEQSKHRPSRKLMDHVGQVIKGNSEYVLLDEQLVVYDKVCTLAKEGFSEKKKNVLIIKGGPGTGKSVIALNLMADLLLEGFNAHYATGSRAFTETLRKVIGSRGGVQFKYFNSYRDAEYNEIDVLIADEAHRIRKTSDNRYTRKSDRTDIAQINELLNAAKLAVFFIDDDQVVRPNEIGSVQYIRQYAEQANCQVAEYELEAQFRCSGSDAFVNWINNTLGIRKTANAIWESKDEFDFQILDSPLAVEKAIKVKIAEGSTGRMTAGFCWQWSKPTKDGDLVDDVVINGYKRPWNAKPDAGRLAPGIPKSNFWAYDPEGINQIGCIYTAQGFEFDYVGVIFGKDLIHDLDVGGWTGDRSESHDSVVKRSGDQFIELVKNTYRVLFSRGMKGCYVHFIDKDTERFFRSRIES